MPRSKQIDVARGDLLPGNEVDARGKRARLFARRDDPSPPEIEILHAFSQARIAMQPTSNTAGNERSSVVRRSSLYARDETHTLCICTMGS